MSDVLIYTKTDKGHYAVRPIEWTGIWNDKGEIKELGLNHTAIFAEKQSAKEYCDMINGKQIKSNADRIRSMSDKELVEWIWKHDTKATTYGRWTRAQIMEHLQKESEE